jgi:1,4-dihydroxy-2-naphthoate octaprenyltransferase
VRAPAHHWPAVAHPWSDRQRRILSGLWRLVDPKIALASVVPFLVGLALSFSQLGRISWGIAATAFFAIFLIEVGKNAVNDLCDYQADAAVREDERSPFSGGKRTLVDELLVPTDLTVIAWIAFTIAGLVGMELAMRTRPMLLLLGAAAAAISILYALPPVRLAARGLGELAVFAVYGPGIVIGTMMLTRATVDTEAVVVSIALGLLIANVLLINEIPDERVDALAGKRTLVVRLGRENAGSLIAAIFTLAVAIPVTAAASGAVPFRMTAFFMAVPSAVMACAVLRSTKSGPPVQAQALTLVTYVLTGLGYAAVALMV